MSEPGTVAPPGAYTDAVWAALAAEGRNDREEARTAYAPAVAVFHDLGVAPDVAADLVGRLMGAAVGAYGLASELYAVLSDTMEVVAAAVDGSLEMPAAMRHMLDVQVAMARLLHGFSTLAPLAGAEDIPELDETRELLAEALQERQEKLQELAELMG